MITLYHCHAARSFRPLWMLEEMGLPYDLKMLPFPPRVFAKEYLALNPLGTIPLMIDGETRMTESSGICHYLGTRHGPTPLVVGVDEPAYGAFLNWMYFSDATLTFPQTLVLRYSQLEPEERRNPQVATTTPNGSSAGCGRSKPPPPRRRRSSPTASPRPISSSASRCGLPKTSGYPRISGPTSPPTGNACRRATVTRGPSPRKRSPASSRRSRGVPEGYRKGSPQINRHCERSEAIHKATRKNGLLRRFAPRNDGKMAACPGKSAESLAFPDIYRGDIAPDFCILVWLRQRAPQAIAARSRDRSREGRT